MYWEHKVLYGILSLENAAYGAFSIMEVVEDAFDCELPLSVLYSILGRLKQKKFVKSELAERDSSRGPLVKCYRVTERGKASFRHFLADAQVLLSELDKVQPV